MRTVLVAVLTAAVVGCAATGGPQSKPPVVSERPKLSERLRVARQREAEQATVNDTVVTGEVVRQ